MGYRRYLGGDSTTKAIERYSEAYQKRKLRLFGHVVRAEDEDPMRQVALEKSTIKNKAAVKRRVGKPKLDWVHENIKNAWKQLRK